MSDYALLDELSRELEVLDEELLRLMEEWEEHSRALEQMKVDNT